MEYVIKTTNSELYHHGILGMKWGVRRYQNPDGSLTAAGKQRQKKEGAGSRTAAGKIKNKSGLSDKQYKKFYKEEPSKYSDSTYDMLTKAGHKHNEQLRSELNRLKGATLYNAKKVNKNLQSNIDSFNELRKKNSEHYLAEREKWHKQEGKYKNKDYYQFKDISYDDWIHSQLGKKESEYRNNIRKIIDDTAKEMPLYNKPYKELNDSVIKTKDFTGSYVSEITIGKKIVNDIMHDIEYEYAKKG